ncbi:sensor domain-containing diguanylate cyclase [Hydrogenimonas sp.]|uniref:GGDEF domain-containing protein n=1 Tax=Hydrogenimonas sp. TaxID=2231112 RepID=UPI00262B2E03|nr:sensor domain-containing diguanylate cyclase [Hydrogenimonas sp.]
MTRYMSISTRIITVVTLVFVLLLGIVNYSHYMSVRQFTKKSEIQKSRLTLDSIAPIVSINLYLDMIDPMHDYLMKIVQQNPMILKLEVHDMAGKKYFGYTSPRIHARKLEPLFQSTILHDKMSGNAIGRIDMLYSNEKYEELLDYYGRFTIFLMAIAMILLALLLFWLRSYLSPLKRLVDELKAYDPKKQNFPKEKVENRDEIAVIQNAMVDMFEKIENYTTKLFELNLKLETKVKERTETLEQTNRLLRQEIIERTRTEEALKYANKMLEKLSTKDALTDLYNRRMFEQTLKNYWKMSRREGMPISLLICDIDYFKRINDTYGHQAGDRCLKELADILTGCIKRPMDMVARYGGEEFIYILPDTPLEGALKIAHEIQETLEKRNSNPDTEITFTLSIGVACMIPDEDEKRMDLLRAADLALYEAKKKGRNRIEVHPL